MIAALRNALSRFRGDTDGSASIEFVILFPAFLAILCSAFESGTMMARNVMLERAVDIAVRDLRLGSAGSLAFDDFKNRICENTLILANCTDVVQIELQPVDTSTWSGLTADVRCIDEGTTINPIDETRYALGMANEMMIIRVCALYDPFFSVVNFGMRMPSDGYGNYALVATSAFVNEPS